MKKNKNRLNQLWFNQFNSVQLRAQSSSIRLGFKQDQTNQTTNQLSVQLVDLTCSV